MKNLKDTFREVFLATLPIVLLVLVLLLRIADTSRELVFQFLLGAAMMVTGLSLFLFGVKLGLLPLGEMVGAAVIRKGKGWLVLLLGFLISFVVTIAEPGLQILSVQMGTVSDRTIGHGDFLITIALGLAIFVTLALLRMLLKIPIVYLLAGCYLLIGLLSMIVPPEYIAVSFDAGGITTGPMTVPFILAFGVGVSSVLSRKSSSGDSFGLVGIASLGPILAVLILGVIEG